MRISMQMLSVIECKIFNDSEQELRSFIVLFAEKESSEMTTMEKIHEASFE